MSMIISDLSDRKMIIRKLGIADRKAFFELTDAVVEALANKESLILSFLPPLIQITSAITLCGKMVSSCIRCLKEEAI